MPRWIGHEVYQRVLEAERGAVHDDRPILGVRRAARAAEAGAVVDVEQGEERLLRIFMAASAGPAKGMGILSVDLASCWTSSGGAVEVVSDRNW